MGKEKGGGGGEGFTEALELVEDEEGVEEGMDDTRGVQSGESAKEQTEWEVRGKEDGVVQDESDRGGGRTRMDLGDARAGGLDGGGRCGRLEVGVGGGGGGGRGGCNSRGGGRGGGGRSRLAPPEALPPLPRPGPRAPGIYVYKYV